MKSLFHPLLCMALLVSAGRAYGQLAADNGAQAEARSAASGGLTEKLYALTGNSLLWLCDDCASKRNALHSVLARAGDYGLPAAAYHPERLLQNASAAAASAAMLLNADKAISEIAIAFCQDLYRGREMHRWTSYDGISEAYAEKDATLILEGLSAAKDSAGIVDFISGLEPLTPEYRALKAALKSDTSDELCLRQLRSSLNYLRWMQHFRLDSFIVVNIPSATLRYYKADTVALEMRAVMGTPGNRTPRFAAFCKEVTLYPYWNMPRSILMKEWLAAFRKNPGLIDFLNMEVIDARGRVVPASAIHWQSVSRANFSYRIREKPGCFNPMGVIKFTLTSPYDIYLHDTNFKGAFLSARRFYSHGCIRLEEPIALADALLVNKVDAGFLKACFKDQQPQVIQIAHPVPVFVVYMCAEGDSTGAVSYFHDVYGLIK